MQLSLRTNVLILSHFYKRTISGGGPPQDIRDYLIPKIKNIYYIEHPFPSADDRRSSLSIYKNGILKTKIFSPKIYGPEILFYLIDFLITFYFIFRSKKRFELCIALDNLNTVSVLPFRWLRIIKKLVYYTIDYTPQRFKNATLNSLYHLIDRVACYHADRIWVLSERMITAREKNGVNPQKSAKNILLPMGANLSRIEILPLTKINRHEVAFVGFLMEKQGVQFVLKSLPKIILKIPNFKFIIIGDGDYKQKLVDLTKKLKIGKHVLFKGFINDYKIVENILCKSAVGVAPYVPTPENYTFYADPGKIKLYLGCGLPVVLTNVPKIAHVIKSKKAGIVIDYSEKSFVKNLVKLLSDKKLYKKYRKNAIELSKTYDTNVLINKALNKT